MTTNGINNPGFTVIDYDEEYMVPVNIHTWAIDLNEANKSPNTPPVFREIHDWLNEYNLEDMRPTNLADLGERLYNDEALAKKYELNRSKGADVKDIGKLHNPKFKCVTATESF